MRRDAVVAAGVAAEAAEKAVGEIGDGGEDSEESRSRPEEEVLRAGFEEPLPWRPGVRTSAGPRCGGRSRGCR